jgi:hypothetical protein
MWGVGHTYRLLEGWRIDFYDKDPGRGIQSLKMLRLKPELLAS